MSELEELAARYPYSLLNIRRLHVMILDIALTEKLLALWVAQGVTDSTIIFSIEESRFKLDF